RDFTQARRHLSFCLQARPEDVSVHLLAAQAARRAGDLDAATRHLDRCLEVGASGDATALEANLLRAQQGELTPAVEGYLKIRLQDQPPETPLILEAMTWGYVQTGQLLEARAGVEELLEWQPDHALAPVWHGEILERLQCPRLALEPFRRAVELDPEQEYGRLCLAELLMTLNQPGDAAPHFEFLHGRQPDNLAVALGL